MEKMAAVSSTTSESDDATTDASKKPETKDEIAPPRLSKIKAPDAAQKAQVVSTPSKDPSSQAKTVAKKVDAKKIETTQETTQEMKSKRKWWGRKKRDSKVLVEPKKKNERKSMDATNGTLDHQFEDEEICELKDDEENDFDEIFYDSDLEEHSIGQASGYESGYDEFANQKATEPRLDSFDSYIVVSVLTATASFAALLDDKPEGDKSLTQHPYARNAAIVLCAICSLSGIYSTVVFSFSSIYGRTAVGIGKMEAYKTFLQETGPLRYKAFCMYLLSLVLFIVLLVIAAADKIDESLQLPFLTFLTIMSANVYRDWSKIIISAGKIFAAPPENEKRKHGMTLRSKSRKTRR